MNRTLFLILMVAAAQMAQAGPFYDLAPHVSSTTLKVSGVIKIAASTPTYATPVITLDGAAGLISAPAVTLTGAMAAATGSYSSLLSLNGAPMAKFNSGGGNYTGLQAFLSGGIAGVQLYDYDGGAYANTVGLKMGGTYGPVLYGGGDTVPLFGINTAVPTRALDVTGGAIFSSSVAVQGQLDLHTYTETKSSAAVATTYDVSWSSGSVYWLSLTDSTTLTFSGAKDGQSLTIFLKQNVGSKTITWPTVSWPAATAPTLTTTAGKLDIMSFVYVGGVYYGFQGGLNY